MAGICERVRNWLLKPVVEAIANQGAKAEVERLTVAVGRLQSTVGDLVDSEDLGPVLSVLRSEPAVAFKKWLDERLADQKKFEARERELLERWRKQAETQQYLIDLLTSEKNELLRKVCIHHWNGETGTCDKCGETDGMPVIATHESDATKADIEEASRKNDNRRRESS